MDPLRFYGRGWNPTPCRAILRTMGIRLRLLVLPLLAASSAGLPAQGAETLVEGLSLFGSARAVSMRVEMELRLKNGRKDRSLDVFLRQVDRRTQVLIQVAAPAFLTSMKFLSMRDEGGLETTWMKTSQGVRRLTDSSGGERVFDSDFTAEDFLSVSARRFALAVLPDSTLGSTACRVVEARPRTAGSYARKLLYIGAADQSLRGIDFLDEGGTLIRRYRLTATQIIDGGTYPQSAVMENLRDGTATALSISRVDLKTDLPDRLFNKGSL